jgi:hypothetical protein
LCSFRHAILLNAPTILASLTRIQEQVGLLRVGRSYARKIRRTARWTRFNDRSTSAPEPPCQAMYAGALDGKPRAPLSFSVRR